MKKENNLTELLNEYEGTITKYDKPSKGKKVDELDDLSKELREFGKKTAEIISNTSEEEQVKQWDKIHSFVSSKNVEFHIGIIKEIALGAMEAINEVNQRDNLISGISGASVLLPKIQKSVKPKF